MYVFLTWPVVKIQLLLSLIIIFPLFLLQFVDTFKAINYNPKAASISNCVDTPEFIEAVGAVSLLLVNYLISVATNYLLAFA